MATPGSSLKKRGKVFYLRFSENGARKRVSLHTDSLQTARERQRQFDSARARGQRSRVSDEDAVGTSCCCVYRAHESFAHAARVYG